MGTRDRLLCQPLLNPWGLQAQMQSMGPALQRQRSVRGVDLTALGGEPGLVQRCLGGHAGAQAFTPYLLRPTLQVGCCHTQLVWLGARLAAQLVSVIGSEHGSQPGIETARRQVPWCSAAWGAKQAARPSPLTCCAPPCRLAGLIRVWRKVTHLTSGR